MERKSFTKEAWKSLTDKQRWDIMVALRGPDLIGSETLKWFTTAVIRAAVEGIIRPEGGSAVINRDLGFVVLDQRRGWRMPGPSSRGEGPRLDFDASHFSQHVDEAAALLGIERVAVPSRTYWSWMQGRGIGPALEQFFEWLQLSAKVDAALYTPKLEIVGRMLGRSLSLDGLGLPTSAKMKVKPVPFYPEEETPNAASGL